jgi:DNA (cytosine-5)-methyltransferase 1
MLLIDFYCKAGGASVGYQHAGFEVLGVDIDPQPRYPFPFLQMDALTALDMLLAGERLTFSDGFDVLLGDVTVVAGSCPCQRFSRMTRTRHGDQAAAAHPDLIGPTRDRFQALDRPYIIENVEGAPLIDPVCLCGSMWPATFELRRHRIFECSFPVAAPGPCAHDAQTNVVGVYGHTGAGANRGRERARGRTNGVADWRRAMGIDWMTRDELAQAIPPTYTEHLGRQVAAHLQETACSI